MAATICVYGSSSTRTKQSYLGASYELGAVLGKRGHVCINGGGRYGCMVSSHYKVEHITSKDLKGEWCIQGSLNEGCRSENGSVVGVIHQMFVLDGGKDDNISDMLVSTGDDLSERKRLLLDNADAVIVLPVCFWLSHVLIFVFVVIVTMTLIEVIIISLNLGRSWYLWRIMGNDFCEVSGI